MVRELLKYILDLFGGNLDVHPAKLTAVQSALVTALALLFAVLLYLTVGIHYPGIWYQVFASLLIASVLGPIFLYPTFKTSQRLRNANAIIKKQATTDHLTGLPNMLALSKRVEAELSRQKIGDLSHGQFALHFLDLDRFKQVNDSLGHDAGNNLLVQIATKLQNWVGPDGFVARFGGDEFVIIQNSVNSQREAKKFAKLLSNFLAGSYRISDQTVIVRVTIGTALSPLHGNNSEQVLKAADIALFKAKSEGVPLCMFKPELAKRAENRRKTENVLQSALENGHLKPHFQSIVRISNPLDIVGFEALARIELPNGNILRPDEFIPVAESTGMVVELGRQILNQACEECSHWNDNVFVAVNVSPTQIVRSDFLKTVQDALSISGLAANRLELEITESVLINDIGIIRPILSELRNMGIRIALDDFGSGFCGLHYLRQITIDKIKIDKSIIDDAGSVRIATNILKSVAGIAREMNLTLTAEGVDTIDKAEYLASEGCAEQMQGYLFSRPVCARQARQMLEFMGKERVEMDGMKPAEIGQTKRAG